MDRSAAYSVADAAQRLGMLARTVQRYCAAGLVGRKLGRDWVLSEADLSVLSRFVGRPEGHAPSWKNGNPEEKR